MTQQGQLSEAFGPIAGGVHGGLHPSLLSESQFSRGLNVSTRGGFVSTRPGFTKLLDLGSGVFQGAGRYRLNNGDRIMFVKAGKIYQIKLFESPLSASEYAVSNTTRTKRNGTADPYPLVDYTEVFSPDFGKDDDGEWSTRVNMIKAERYFIVQDGYHQPVIIGENNDPDSARVSVQSPYPFPGSNPTYESTEFHYSEVPVGAVMAYASYRILVSPRYLWEDLTGVYPADPQSGRMMFVASDIDSDPGAKLRFTETNIANGGGALGTPLESGFIQAMAPFRNSESVDGNGALVVLGQDGVSAFTLAFERASWGDAKQTISQMLFQDVGTHSPNAVVAVNDDLWFRRADGLASLRYTATQQGGKSGSLSITPQSFEVFHRLELDTFADLPHISMDFADNRLFLTSGGATPGGLGFRGLVVLDSASLYSMSQAPSPVFDDIWTGLDFLQVVSARFQGKESLFVFARCGGSLGLYIVDTAAKSDDGTPILSRMYTRQFSFKSADIKKFSRCELWIRDLVGDAEIALYYRADGYYLWKKCGTLSVRAGTSGFPQSRYRLTLAPTEENPCDSASGRPLRAGSAFQFCLEWTGSLKIEKAMFFADIERALEPSMQCEEETAVELVEDAESGVVLNDFEYSSCGD